MGLAHNPKIVTDGLVLCLDAANPKSYSGSGTTWTDLSKNGNDGTLTNGPTFDSANKGSIDFDGANDYVDIGNCTDFFPVGSQSHNLTVSLWVKLPATTNNIIFGQQNVSNERLYISTYNGNWDIGWGQYGWGSVGVSSGSFINSSTNWTHLVIRVLNGVATLYVNSIQSISKADNIVDLQGKMPIGAYFYLNSFDGISDPNNISNVQIYNRALTADEIKQNFAATRGRYGI